MSVASVVPAFASLRIHKHVLDAIHACARIAGSYESMGLLAVEIAGDPNVVTAACLLPAQASGSHAVAAPLVLGRAVRLLQRNSKVPVGLWHSHGNHSVFHSGTDDDTVQRMAPSLAANVYRCAAQPSVPAVMSRDSAVLPLANGRLLQVSLIGPPIPGFDGATEPASWMSIRVAYQDSRNPPRVIRDLNAVTLLGGGIRLRLEIPEGATISVVETQQPGVRYAHLWSLVVNRRGEQYVEAIMVHDHDGATVVSTQRTEVVCVETNERAGVFRDVRSLVAPVMLSIDHRNSWISEARTEDVIT